MFHLTEELISERCRFDQQCSNGIHFLSRKRAKAAIKAAEENSAPVSTETMTVRRLSEILELILISEFTTENWSRILSSKLKSDRTEEALNQELLALARAGILGAALEARIQFIEGKEHVLSSRISWEEEVRQGGISYMVISSSLDRTDYGMRLHHELREALKSSPDADSLLDRVIAL